MSDPKNTYDAHEVAWPFEEVTKFGHAAAREQQRRLQAYLAETNAPLTAALAAEAARFDVVKRKVIDPVMREVAEEAARRGWHASVALDDDLDRLDVLATPGIRFYCSRRPIRGETSELIWPPCFIAFFGCAQSRAVRTHVETSEIDPDAVPARGAPLDYTSVTHEAVGAMLHAFIADLERISQRTRHP